MQAKVILKVVISWKSRLKSKMTSLICLSVCGEEREERERKGHRKKVRWLHRKIQRDILGKREEDRKIWQIKQTGKERDLDKESEKD